jgi:hypothetical protein
MKIPGWIHIPMMYGTALSGIKEYVRRRRSSRNLLNFATHNTMASTSIPKEMAGPISNGRSVPELYLTGDFNGWNRPPINWKETSTMIGKYFSV